jgi:DNA-directed RNA polymerase I subunit RPA2
MGANFFLRVAALHAQYFLFTITPAQTRHDTADTPISCSRRPLIPNRNCVCPREAFSPAAAMAPAPTDTKWTTEFDTARRQHLFRNPPKDKTAYPTLAETVLPHINSFNAIWRPNGQLAEAIKDIGTKVFLDGNPQATPENVGPRNRLHVRIQEVFYEKSVLPPANKYVLKNRNVLPAESRERHSTYRGKLVARIEYKINNGDWVELVRDLGYVPIMLRVRSTHTVGPRQPAANALVTV